MSYVNHNIYVHVVKNDNGFHWGRKGDRSKAEAILDLNPFYENIFSFSFL